MSLTSEQNAIIDDGLDDFHNAMKQAGEIAWADISEYLETLEIDSNNHVANTQYNQDVGNQISISIMDGANSQEYSQGIESMKNAVDELADATRQYYAEQDVYLQTTAYNYDRMLKGLQTTIKNEIDQAFSFESYAANIMQPAINAYYQNHVGQGSTLDATMKDMQHRIEARFYNYSVTSSLTIMQQYARRVNEIFATYGTDDLIWVEYQGVLDDVTRDFCRYYLEKSKYYHVDEVKQWPGEWANDWDGMIPNTDQSSIFVNAGGFNCRHSFVYVTQKVVEKEQPGAIARAVDKGLNVYYRGEN